MKTVRNLIMSAALALGGTMASAETKTSTVVEIASFQLNEGVEVADFAALDARVAEEHVSQQPGFVSRESGFAGNAWVAIVHWETAADSQASMDSFASAPAAAEFMANLDASTMTMTLYELNN